MELSFRPVAPHDPQSLGRDDLVRMGNGLDSAARQRPGEIVHGGLGRVTGLRPIAWSCVVPRILPSGRLGFDVSMHPNPRNRLIDTEVFFLRDRSDDGVVGRSRVSRAPDVIGNAHALQDLARHAWRNQATLLGAVEIEGTLNQSSFDRLQAQFEQNNTGTRNARRVLILDNTAK